MSCKTRDEFDEIVRSSHAQNVVVMFSSTWCQPCKMMKKILEDSLEEYKEFAFVYVDIDEQPVVASSYDVSAIPTIIVVSDGVESCRHVGVVNKTKLVQSFDSCIKHD